MSLLEKIQQDLKESMKAREADRTRTLRGLISKMKERRIELNRDLDDDEALKVLKKAAKERNDSAGTYEKAGRTDLVATELTELKVIETYLPEEISEDKIVEMLKKIIAETGAESMRDMGKVMGPAMKELGAQADGKIVQACVRNLLGG